jgi:hypothetical protein
MEWLASPAVSGDLEERNPNDEPHFGIDHFRRTITVAKPSLERPLSIVRGALALWLLALAGASPTAATAARWRVFATYSGSGDSRTLYRSHPPNQGGSPDHDYAKDSETQRWSLRFTDPFAAGGCADAPCLLTASTGTTAITASIDHVHRDGLYRKLDRAVKCHLSDRTAGGESPGATLQYRWIDGRRRLAVTALDPVATALFTLPTACPSQGGDSVDGLADNYLGPGYSLAAGWGADRWFTSRTVVVAVRALQRAGRVRIALGLTQAGTSPANCATTYPWQQCVTGGAWSGVLTLDPRR